MPHANPLWTTLSKHRVVDETDEHGHLVIFVPKSSVCVTRVSGHLSGRMAQRWIDVLDPHFKRGVVFDTFHDWEEMTSYDSRARRSLTTWVVDNHANIRSAHFLVGARLVAMGVSAAGLAAALVGLKMEVDRVRAPFEVSIAAVLA